MDFSFLDVPVFDIVNHKNLAGVVKAREGQCEIIFIRRIIR